VPIYQAIILGIIQGVTEFLPVSSSGHLILIRQMLGWKDPGLSFDVALHFGTLIAVLIYFAETWAKIVRAAFGVPVRISEEEGPQGELSQQEVRQQRLLLWFLVAATIPGAVMGKLFEKQAEESFRQPALIAAMMIIVAVIMWWSEKVGSFQKPLTRITLVDAITVGAAQAAAIIPGVSRSGSTIAAGLFRGMGRDAAARFSFLLATPIIGGAVLLSGWHLRRESIPPEMARALLAGVSASAVVGYAAIAAFIRYLRTQTLRIFIVYRIIFGIIILALVYRGYL
jgi:undecaprenyl-diphosphatase